MRELKFRAWVYYGEKLEKPHYSNEYSLSRFFEDHDECCDDQCIEQYTGLKDKNGKEIYEGDIVKINGWWDAAGPAGYNENLCAVKWDEEITGFAPFNDYDCDCGVYHHAEDCEVIGNIHENPELLGEEG